MRPFVLVVVLTGSCCSANALAQTSAANRPARSTTTQTAPRNTGSAHLPVRTILARAKAASGGAAWNRIRSLRIEATVETGGLSGSVTDLQDFRTGRSVTHLTLGPSHGVSGFDGRTGWVRWPNGGVSTSDTRGSREDNVTAAYEMAHAWWFPERWPATITSIGPQTNAHGRFHVLRVTPRGGHPFELWINATTHLIARTVDRSGSVPVTAYFKDYRKVDGIRFAFVQRSSRGQKGYDATMRVQRVTVNGPLHDAAFAIPHEHFDDASFIGGGDKATLPFRLVENHIRIPVQVNGHSLHFALDTGATGMLSTRAARAAGIEAHGKLPAQGLGTQTVATGMARVKRLELGGKIVLRNQAFNVLPLPEVSSTTPVDGLIGYGVFKRFVVRIDYAHHTLTFIRPTRFNAAHAGTLVPLKFGESRTPTIAGSLDGIPGLFQIDTGSGAALDLSAPFAKKHDLTQRYASTVLGTVTGAGIGGTFRDTIARAGKLMLGSVAVSHPLVALNPAKRGAIASKDYAGIIGGKVLKQFTVTLDYPHHRMYLKPNANYGKPMQPPMALQCKTVKGYIKHPWKCFFGGP